MGTTYEYTYEYEITDPNKNSQRTAGNAGNHTHRSVGFASNQGGAVSHTSRSDMVDPLANLQHDRIWSKLYDPVSMDKAQHDIEIQKMARRQDRKIIKIEAAYGSDRQTFIVKRDYELRVRDVTDEAARVFKIPSDQVIIFWKGRNICDTPDALLESLGVENNNTMRIARADDQSQRNRQQGQLSSLKASNQQGSSSSSGGFYGQQGSSSGGAYGQQQSGSGGYYAQQGSSSSGAYGQQQGSSGTYGQQGGSAGETYSQQTYYPQYQQQTYYQYPTGYDQYNSNGSSGHQCNCTCHQDQHHKCCCHCHGSTNHYQQLTNQTVSTPVTATYIISLQIGCGDRIQGLAIGRQHPVTLYDLQVELQQHFNIPILEQQISYNGMPLTHLLPDTSLQTIGIVNNAFISLWYKNNMFTYQQQPLFTDYYSPRQQETSSFYGGDGSQSLRSSETSSRRMYYSNSENETVQNSNSQEVLKIEVFYGSERHVLILRSTNNIRVSDLMEELQKITNVPVQNQTLYYRGQQLQSTKERSLRDVGLENNAQVRLIGESTKSRYVPIMTGNQDK